MFISVIQHRRLVAHLCECNDMENNGVPQVPISNYMPSFDGILANGGASGKMDYLPFGKVSRN